MVFLRELYASTRAEELARVPWLEQQKAAFLSQQFECQHRAYSQGYPGASLDLILEGERPVGRLYVHRGPDDFRVVDISLLPQARNRGIGTYFLLDVMDQARAANATVSIHVEQSNSAARLYERLGFRAIESQGIYTRMEWRPAERTTGT
ncbi:MAG: GNAT family N-acetyltransferase [Candidatus Wallbacteria bacterium]|nr:GNAT family N-acetyltransferase [Candidatus Wallbacteria bacterium]MBI4867374.1 GNAT family N-acetyltransferase [Candidatus Wallbacteria bacterium]